MSFVGQPLRRAAAQAPKMARNFSSTKPSLGGHGDEPHYVHATHMYEITNMKNRTLKMTLAIGSIVVAGLGIPAVASAYQIKKSAG